MADSDLLLRSMLEQQQAELLKRLDWQDGMLDGILKSWRTECRYEGEPSLPPIHEEDDINVDIERNHDRQVSEIADMAIPWRSFSNKSNSTPSKSNNPVLFRTNTEDEKALRAAAIKREGSDDPEGVGHRFSKRITSEERYEALGCRGKLKVFVTSSKFEIFFGFLIMTNAVFIGAEVEHQVYHPGPAPAQFRLAGYIFTACFLIELILRLTAWGRQFFYADGWMWNYLDCFVVLSSLWDSLMELLYVLSDDHNVSGGLSLTPLRVVRIVRITRLVRVTKIARILRFIKALRTLVMSIIATLKSLFWAGVLMLLIMYSFSIVFAQAASNRWADDTESGAPHDSSDGLHSFWRGLPRSMLTLFLSISGGVSWTEALQPLEDCGSFYVFLFLFYISFAYFAVLNVVTGVFCQSAIESAQSDHDLIMSSIIANKNDHVEKVKMLFKNLDDDDSGYISLVELEENMSKPAVQTYFQALELNVSDAWNFFKLLDTDGGSAIEIEEFLMGCLRLRGPARALDLAKLQNDHQWMMKQLGRFANYVEVALKKLEKHLKHVKENQSPESRGVPYRRPRPPMLSSFQTHDATVEAEGITEVFDTPEKDCMDMEIKASLSSTFFEPRRL